MKALVIGGTGPTGHYIVNGLIDRGYSVAMLHTGTHEVDEIPASVEHIHTDPFSADALGDALGNRSFDLTIAAYGRLRRIAEVMVGRTARFISIGSASGYSGFMNAAVHCPNGMPVPTAEDAPLVPSEDEDAKGYRVARTEQAVFEHHPAATHFRYPLLYGPYQIVQREWCIVRRILDGRRSIIVPDDGLTLYHSAYAKNAAQAVLLGVDCSDAAAGEVYNCGDQRILSLRQIIEVIAEALERDIEIVSMPWQFAIPARPMIAQPWTTHRVLDLTKIRSQLGYSDAVPPERGIALTAKWLVEHPERGKAGERILQDPFDYRAEDEIIAAWKKLCAEMPATKFEREPRYTASYTGPGGRRRSGSFE